MHWTSLSPTPLPMVAWWFVTPHHVAHNLKHLFLKHFNGHNAISDFFFDFPKKSYGVQLSWGKYTYKNPIIFSLRIILKLSNPYPISHAFFYRGGASVNLTILGNLGRNWHHSNSYELNQTCLYPVFGRNSSLTPNFQELFLNDDKGECRFIYPCISAWNKKM